MYGFDVNFSIANGKKVRFILVFYTVKLVLANIYKLLINIGLYKIMAWWSWGICVSIWISYRNSLPYSWLDI